jgi:4a-hydroxytetrahydrobiopterin dehydratase
MSCQQITPQWASNAKDNDPEVLNQRLTKLLAPNGRWVLTPSGEGVQRLLRFKTFKNAWGFMQTTTDEIKKVRHHPEWSNTYNTVFVRWTTHSPKGLSHLDIHLAEATDRVAEEFQELKEPSGNSANDGTLVGLVDDITKSAGDCCVPKKKPAEC